MLLRVEGWVRSYGARRLRALPQLEAGRQLVMPGRAAPPGDQVPQQLARHVPDLVRGLHDGAEPRSDQTEPRGVVEGEQADAPGQRTWVLSDTLERT